jgi:hypothetical protein
VSVINSIFTNFTGGFLNLLDASLNFYDCVFTNFVCSGYDSLMKVTQTVVDVRNITVLKFSGQQPGALFKFGQES